MNESMELRCATCGRQFAYANAAHGSDGTAICPTCGLPVALTQPVVAAAPLHDMYATSAANGPLAGVVPAVAPAAPTPPVIADSAPTLPRPSAPVASTLAPAMPVMVPGMAPVQQPGYAPYTAGMTTPMAPAPPYAATQGQTAPYYAGQPGGAMGGYGTVTGVNGQVPQGRARRPAPWLVFVGGFVAAVVLIALAVGAFAALSGGAAVQRNSAPSATATPTATTPAGFSRFKDAGGAYSMDYPTDWTKSSVSGQAQTSSAIFSGGSAVPGAAMTIITTPGITTPGVQDPKVISAQIFQGFNAVGQVSNQTGPSDVSLAGETWQQSAADITLKGSTSATTFTSHLVALVATHKGETFVIEYQAVQATFDGVDARYFQVMLASFTFGAAK